VSRRNARPIEMASPWLQWGQCAALMLAAGLGGCASPGLPKPPSLGLPAVVTDLSATRERDHVTLRFTAPSRATDKLPLQGTIAASLCRQESAGSCVAVLRRSFSAGNKPAVITLEDELPPQLAAGPPVLLTYRVTLYNDKGRAAAPSNAAYAAAGDAPLPVSEFSAAASSGGAELRWRAVPGTDFVELQRIRKGPPPSGTKSAAAGETARPKSLDPLRPVPEPDVVELRAGGGGSDAGGTIDTSAQFGQSYSYIAWRVRRLTVAGHEVEVRSAPSAPAELAMRDAFPPKVPEGLAAVPASGKPGVDLSWEPNAEADLAGYFIYRADAGGAGAGAPERLNAIAVAAPAYRDSAVAAGGRYRYSVSAVDESGNESGRSAEVEQSIE
jgi:hypothetical protein